VALLGAVLVNAHCLVRASLQSAPAEAQLAGSPQAAKRPVMQQSAAEQRPSPADAADLGQEQEHPKASVQTTLAYHLRTVALRRAEPLPVEELQPEPPLAAIHHAQGNQAFASRDQSPEPQAMTRAPPRRSYDQACPAIPPQRSGFRGARSMSPQQFP
jgi:hypothetical protein